MYIVLNCAIKSDSPIKTVKLHDRKVSFNNISEAEVRLGILAETEDGKEIEIEMQVIRCPFIMRRFLVHWLQDYIFVHANKNKYHEPKRTICLNILDCNFFDDDSFSRVTNFVDVKSNKNMAENIEIQFIELNKVKKFDKDSPITFWIEFLKDPNSEACKQLYKLVPEINDAKEVFEGALADKETLKIIQERENYIRDYLNSMKENSEETIN